MENNQEVKLNSSAWILSYVDFMTVIMAFFIVFVMIITKVDDVTELFIVKNITLLEKALALEKKGLLSEAEEIYKKLIKNNYRNEIVFINYGSICQHFSEILRRHSHQ